MNYPMAIVFSSALLVGSCVMNQPPAISQSTPAAKFQIAAGGPNTAWRVNTDTGTVWYCSTDGATKPKCIRSD